MTGLLVAIVLVVTSMTTLGTTVRVPGFDPEGSRIALGSSCVDDRGSVRPSGELETVPGSSPGNIAPRQVTYTVEIEGGLPVDAACFARVVEYTLHHPLGWTADGSFAFRRIDEGVPDVRVTLASPGTVDALCSPLRTGGIFSCWNGGRAVVNYRRWLDGAADFGDDLVTYRIYVLNHEVGHGLGHGHRGCAEPGLPAPVMVQQTKTVEGCLPNGWPARSSMS